MKKLILLTTLLMSSQLHSFTLNYSQDVYFPNSTVTVNVSTGDCSAAGITAAEIKEWLTSVADDYWNTVSTSALELKVGSEIGTDLSGVTSTTFGNATAFAPIEDNTILVGCNDMNTNFSDDNVTSSTLAGATIASLSSGKVVGMVLINTNADFSDHTQNIAVLAHEVGHALGLGHSSDPVALMFYAVGGKTQTRLTMDDRDGITYLYPQEKKIFASCGTIALMGNQDDNNNNSGSGPMSFLIGFLGITLILGLLRRWSRILEKMNYGFISRRQTYPNQ